MSGAGSNTAGNQDPYGIPANSDARGQGGYSEGAQFVAADSRPRPQHAAVEALRDPYSPNTPPIPGNGTGRSPQSRASQADARGGYAGHASSGSGSAQRGDGGYSGSTAAPPQMYQSNGYNSYQTTGNRDVQSPASGVGAQTPGGTRPVSVAASAVLAHRSLHRNKYAHENIDIPNYLETPWVQPSRERVRVLF